MRPESAVEAHHFEALGTNCGLFAVDQPRGRLLEGEFWVRRLGARLTRFSDGSELSLLNSSAGRWMAVSDELGSILRASLRAYEASAGLVNVAVLPSMQAIGYRRPLVEGPGIATLEHAHPLPPLPDVLEVRDGEARVARGSGIDLGGVAKGWMADRLAQELGPNAVANLGGDLRAVGLGPRGDGWPVGVAGQTLMLRDQGAATSSVRRRSWGDVHHLIDPRSGLPSLSGLEEVSVVAASGFDAEVVAKTALLLGPVFAPTYCAAHAMAWWLGGARDD
ncbi:MAG: FAD:protein FMN transferase [Chloroflexi bacterium]|nr:MAG: FAD:protein FMN transferase [Chloroflexota bacterium]